MSAALIIRTASSLADMLLIRELFAEYAASLGFNLHFQNFETELATLPGDYAPPRGVLLLAVHEGAPVGCVGVRPLEGSICEMKRLYVRPGLRGLRIGYRLATEALAAAHRSGFATIRLDTLPSMHEARALYLRLGFHEIPAYRHNPIPDTRYLELDLPAP